MPDDDAEHDDDARPIDAPLTFTGNTDATKWNEDCIHGGADDAQD
jgi:hypothetical protein